MPMYIDFSNMPLPPPPAEPVSFDFSDEPLLVAKREAFEQKVAGKTLEELRVGRASYDGVELSVQARNLLVDRESFTIGDTSHITIPEKEEMVSTKLGLDGQELYDTAMRFMSIQERWRQEFDPSGKVKLYDGDGAYGRYYLQNVEKLINEDEKMALLLNDYKFDFDTYKWSNCTIRPDPITTDI